MTNDEREPNEIAAIHEAERRASLAEYGSTDAKWYVIYDSDIKTNPSPYYPYRVVDPWECETGAIVYRTDRGMQEPR